MSEHTSTPSLICISGVLCDREFPLSDTETIIGRDPLSSIPIQDSAMSRRHFKISRTPQGDLLLTDLDSHNGTFVNDVPVRESKLIHRDRIEAGKSVFVLRSSGPEKAPSSSVRALQRADSSSTDTIRMAMRAADPASIPTIERPARELAALLNISTAIQDQRAIEPLARQLLNSLADALPVEFGVVVLFRDGLAEPPWTLSGGPGADSSEEQTYDDTLVRTAIAEQTALLDGVLLTAPISTRDRGLCGAIQLKSRASGARGANFDANHLRLAAAASSIAGLAFDAANRSELAQAENLRLREQLDLRHDMVGESARMKAVYRFVARIAAAPTTVLITGESGTGKELVAQAIHRNSPRSQMPFVAINCASLGEHLLESELFGHEKGAFTGAIAQKKGKFEVASGGTIFLDELGEMPILTQAKLLRVLQQREFERLGGNRTIQVDIRVVAATNRNLAEAVKSGAFRQDLYYRLNVATVDLPALRDRREDIPLLASYFSSRFAKRFGRHLDGLAPETRACLLQYDWPGNVRELENAIERAVVMGSGSLLLPEDLPDMIVEAGSRAVSLGSQGFHAAVVELKKRLILEALDRSGRSVTDAAKLLGLNANYLHRLMNNLDLRADRTPLHPPS